MERHNEISKLVHYTSFQTLNSMLSNEELWFSSADTMNDFAEVRHGKALIRDYVTQDGSTLNHLFKSLLTDHGDLMKEVDSVFLRQLQLDPYDTFISCWSNCDIDSRQHDNLAMWRGYAADGNGVAVVVDPTSIGLGGLTYSEILFWPVFYETDIELIERSERALATFKAVLEEFERTTIDLNPSIVAEAFNEIIYFLAVTHKHKGFIVEKEWRFIWRKGRSSTKFLQYLKPQLIRNALYEYLCLPLKDDPELAAGTLDVRKIISEIMIGPCEDVPHKFNAIHNFLRRKSFPEKFKVTVSDIPYRSR